MSAAAIGVERGCASRLLPWRDRVVAVPAASSTSGELSDELVDKIADSVVEKLRESGEFSEDAIRGVAQKVVAEATSVSTPAASDVVSFSPSDFLPSAPRSSAESERLCLEGRALYFGLDGVKVGCKRGLKLLEEAMELGSLNAQAEVARARYEERQNSGSVYYEDIVALAQKPAELGNPFAQGTLGDIYASDGPLKSEAKAEEYRKAAFESMSRLAEAGDSLAAAFVGGMYIDGEGAEMNVKEGGAWLRKSADSGCACAMNWLAVRYAQGAGFEQSWKKANEWYLKAAEADNTDAMNNLGYKYANGEVLNEITRRRTNGCKKPRKPEIPPRCVTSPIITNGGAGSKRAWRKRKNGDERPTKPKLGNDLRRQAWRRAERSEGAGVSRTR